MGAPKGKRPTSKERLSIRLPKDRDALLRLVALKNNMTVTEVVERCLNSEIFLDRFEIFY